MAGRSSAKTFRKTSAGTTNFGKKTFSPMKRGQTLTGPTGSDFGPIGPRLEEFTGRAPSHTRS